MIAALLSLALISDSFGPVDFGPLYPEPPPAVDFTALASPPRVIVSTVAPPAPEAQAKQAKQVDLHLPAFPARAFKPPVVPEPRPTPIVYHLADSSGFLWNHTDPEYLRRFVAARNVALAVPSTPGFVAVPGRDVTFPSRLVLPGDDAGPGAAASPAGADERGVCGWLLRTLSPVEVW